MPHEVCGQGFVKSQLTDSNKYVRRVFAIFATALVVAACYDLGAGRLVGLRSKPRITTPSTLPSGTVGEPYSVTLQALGGDGIYRWKVSGGALPDGLTLDSITGIISGTPTTETPASAPIQILRRS